MGRADDDGPAVYALRVRGLLGQAWSAQFAGMALTHNPDGTTTLCGAVRDQAALYGLVARARDLALTLVSLERTQPVAAARSAEERGSACA